VTIPRVWLLALRDLQHRRRQFAVAVVGSSLVFAMALVLAGLSGGFRAEARNTVEAIGGDGFVVRAGGGGPFSGFSGMPAGMVRAVAALPGVTSAAPLVVTIQPLVPTTGGPKVDSHVVGFSAGDLGSPRAVRGRVPARDGEAAVDSRAKLGIGRQFTLAGRQLTVVGLTSGLSYDAGVPNVYVTLADAQHAAYGSVPTISAVAVRGRPAQLPAGLTYLNGVQAQDDILRHLHNALVAVDNTQAFLWLVAAIIIGTVTYLSVLERLRDFAVLKAVGASSRQLYSGLAVQAVVVAVAAAVLAILTARLLTPVIPMPTDIPMASLVLLPFVAVGVGLIASLTGMQQAIRVDPARAFGA
jgi:putative ABC transport system permease protein